MGMQRRKPAGKPAAGRKRAASAKGKPGKPGKSKRAPVKYSLQRRDAVRLKWEGAPPEADPHGREIKRPYKLESLSSAVSRTFERQERVFESALHDALGHAPVASMTFTYESENDHRFVFHLNAALTNRKRAQFAFVVSKRDVDKSDLQRLEHENLRNLHRAMPKHTLRPYRGGILFVPDRLKRAGKGRQLYWYLTQPWGKCREVYAGPSGQFVIHGEKPRLCSTAATDAIRAAICEAVVGSYDAGEGTCLQPPIPLAGEYIAELPARGAPRVFPVTCRRLAKGINPVKLLDLLAGAGRALDDGVYQTIPEDPGIFMDALARAVGREQAVGWLQAYAVALSSRRLKEKPGLPADMLRELLADE